MDTIGYIFDILNLIFLAIIPALVKLLLDVKNFYSELKGYIIEHKVKIEEMEKDIKELRELTNNLVYMLKKNGGDK